MLHAKRKKRKYIETKKLRKNDILSFYELTSVEVSARTHIFNLDYNL